jgi:hypothetical protein
MDTTAASDAASDGTADAAIEAGGPWVNVTNGERCGLQFNAAPTPADVPALAFTPCGTGCEVAVFDTVNWDIQSNQASSTVTGSALSLVVTYLGTGSNPANYVSVLYDATASPRAAWRTGVDYNSCKLGALNGLAWSFFHVVGASVEYNACWFSPAAGLGVAGSAWVNTGTAIGQTANAWPQGWLASVGGTISVVATPTSPSATTVLNAPSLIYDTAAGNDLVTLYARTARIAYQYVPSTGMVSQLWSGGDSVDNWAISDDKFVWTIAHGPQQDRGTYTSAALYFTSLPPTPASVAAAAALPIATVATTASFRTHGDYAGFPVTLSASATSHTLLVVQLSLGKQWKVPAPAGYDFQDVVAVDNTNVYVTMHQNGQPPGYVQQIRRYALAALDALATL